MEKSPSLPEIIELLSVSLKESPRIHAMWLEGSYATGKFNEQSDIDVWLDVNDGAFDEYIATFRQALASVIEIAYESGKKGVYPQNPKLQKHTFYRKGYAPENCIELDLQEHSRNFDFSNTKHAVKVIFDKSNVIART